MANKGNVRGWALVAFGATTKRPTIVCISEDALPTTARADWLIIIRDSDIAQKALPAPATRRHEPDPD